MADAYNIFMYGQPTIANAVKNSISKEVVGRRKTISKEQLLKIAEEHGIKVLDVKDKRNKYYFCNYECRLAIYKGKACVCNLLEQSKTSNMYFRPCNPEDMQGITDGKDTIPTNIRSFYNTVKDAIATSSSYVQ